MKTYCSKKLTDLDGNVLKIEDKEMTLGRVIANSLLLPKENDADGAKKLEKFQLASKCYKGNVVELTAEEAVLIKGEIARVYGPLIVGQSFEFLEGKKDKEDGK